MKYSHIIFAVILWSFSGAVWGQTEDEIRTEKIEVLKQKIEADFAELEDILAEMKALIIRPDTSIITGYYGQSILFSMRPDVKFVGVYLMIDEGYEYTVDELVLPIKSYFDHYDLPVILVKQDEPFKGKGASMLVFVNGKCVWGDQPNGDFSLSNVQQNHEQVFKKIKICYSQAQKGLFGVKNRVH